jgi:hypothetical protein
MKATIVLCERWPLCSAFNPHHELFRNHDLLTDLFITDHSPDQALRDVLADGVVLSEPKAHIHVEFIVVGSPGVDPIVDGFGDMANSVQYCEDNPASIIATLRAPYLAENALRILVMRNHPLTKVADESNVVSARALAANATVTQAKAITAALDTIYQLSDACTDSQFFVLAYHAYRFRDNQWRVSPNTVAIVPKGALSINTLNVHVLPTRILDLFHIDTSVGDYVHHDTACVTIDSSDDLWSCTCRLSHENTTYEIVRYFPTYSLDALPTYFLRMEEPADWRVRDGVSDNLAEDQEWFTSDMPSKLLKKCLPAIRDMTRRRKCITNDFLVLAEHTATDTPPMPSPDDSVISPSESGAPTPETPPPPLQLMWKDLLSEVVTSSYGQDCAAAVIKLLHDLQDSPYTLIIDPNTNIIALHGAHPPSVLEHLSKTHKITLPTTTDEKIRVDIDNKQNIRIGKLNIDLDSFIHCERIVLYRSRNRRKETLSRKQYLGLPRTNKGSVKRFAAKIELSRQLMHR